MSAPTVQSGLYVRSDQMDKMRTPLGDLRNHRHISAKLGLLYPWKYRLHGVSGLLVLTPLRES